MSNHPVDAHGRVLPDPGWPFDRVAPGDLELVRRFCNSVNHENGADRFEPAGGFDAWLVSEGQQPTAPAREDLGTIVAFREALHDLTVANMEGRPAGAAWAAIATAVADVDFRPRATDDGLELVPSSASATNAFLGQLALICIRARQQGTFRRLKSCSHCEWTIYDRSKNQSARWCSMTACGGRHNARTYRERKRNA